MSLSSFINKVNFKIRAIEERYSSGNFTKQLEEFKAKDTQKRFTIKDVDLQPVLHEATATTAFDAHYVYHPAWAARVVQKISPAKHIDISSSLHFCSIVSAFVPTEFYDYRPAILNLNNLLSGKADLNKLDFPDNSIESLSCMHTIEHIGLGRYGDALDPDGDIKAIQELQRVVQKGGNLILVTPVGKSRIQFNAHRIYSYEMINDLFNEFELVNFSLVLDNGDFVSPAFPALVAEQRYGCGCFWYQKK